MSVSMSNPITVLCSGRTSHSVASPCPPNTPISMSLIPLFLNVLRASA